MWAETDRSAGQVRTNGSETSLDLIKIRAGSSSIEVGEWLGNLAHWDLCVLLTYDLDRLTRHALGTPADPGGQRGARVGDDVRRWLLRCEEILGSSIRAVFSQERHRRGWPHWHGVIATGEILARQIAAMEEEWFDEHGYAWIERPREPAGFPSHWGPRAVRVSVSPLTVAEYCTKYLCRYRGLFVVHGFDSKILEILYRLAPRHLVTERVDDGHDVTCPSWDHLGVRSEDDILVDQTTDRSH